MNKVDKIQSVSLANDKLAGLRQYLNRLSKSHGIELDEGILRINLEIDVNKSILFRRLTESVYINLFLLLIEKGAIKYSVVLNRVANLIFSLSKILGLGNGNLGSVDAEKWNSLISNLYEILEIIQNQRLINTTENININEIFAPLNKISNIVRSWQNSYISYASMQSKL